MGFMSLGAFHALGTKVHAGADRFQVSLLGAVEQNLMYDTLAYSYFFNLFAVLSMCIFIYAFMHHPISIWKWTSKRIVPTLFGISLTVSLATELLLGTNHFLFAVLTAILATLTTYAIRTYHLSWIYVD